MCTIDEIDNYICFISKAYIDLTITDENNILLLKNILLTRLLFKEM